MKHVVLKSILLIVFPLWVSAQKELRFNSLDSLFLFADKNSSVIKINDQQTLLAKYQKIAAMANVVNLRNPLTFTATNNTQLPVSFVPAEFLGGRPGTFKELTLGQQYVSNFNITPQIDIINAGAWAQIHSANINEELTATNNLINTKSLHESVAACYYNIISFREQVGITQKNIAAADTLVMIVNDKNSLGLVRQQDVNDAVVNKITLEDKLKQLQVSLEQQYNSLKILCDVQESTPIVLADELNYNQSLNAEMKVNSQLQLRAVQLQATMARSDLRMNRLLNLPVVSLLYSNSTYQNSNSQFFDANPNNKWLNSVYLGAKITFFLPDVNHILSSRNSKISYETSLINLEHGKLQNEIANTQLQLDYEKAYSQFFTSQKVFLLKEENYKMAFNQYSQSILPFDKLLTAFNDLLTSRCNYSSALANLLYSKSKIEISNKIK